MADDLVQEISEDLLKCAICMDRYEQPKILPCFHTFCESCLDLYAKKKGGISFPCPSCRANVNLPGSGVAGLPTNFYVGSLNEKLVRLEELQNNVKEEQEVTCGECHNSELRIDQICEKCEELFCDDCAEIHSKWSFINGHNVLTINEFKREIKKKVLQKPGQDAEIEMCPTHPKDQASLFCDTCKTLICFRCTEEKHSRPDHDYKSLQTLIARTNQLLTHSLTQSDTMLRECTDIAGVHLTSLQRIRESTTHHKQSIRNETKRAKEAIVEEEKKLLQEVAKFESRVFHFYKVRIDEISDWRESVEISQAVIKQVLGKSCGNAEFLTDGQYLGETLSNMRKHHARFHAHPEVEQIAFAPTSKSEQASQLGKIWVPKCIGIKPTGNGSRDAIVVCEDAASFNIHIGNVLSENGLHLKNIFWFVSFRWPQGHGAKERKEGKLCFAVNPGNCVFLGQEKGVACFDMETGTSQRAGRDGDICYKTYSIIRCMEFDESSKLLFIGVSTTRIVAVDPDKNWILSFFIEIPNDLYSPLSMCPHKYGTLFVCESQSMVYEANFKRQCGFLTSCPTAIGGHDFKPVHILRTPCKYTGNDQTSDSELYQDGRNQGKYVLKQVTTQLEFAWFVLWVAPGQATAGSDVTNSTTRWAIAEYNTDNTNVVAILQQPLGMGIPAGILPFESNGFMEITLCDNGMGFKSFRRSTSRTGTQSDSSPTLYSEV